MKTENELFDITVGKLDAGVICLDFRTLPNLVEIDGFPAYLGRIGYSNVHFQLAPKDAMELGRMLFKAGSATERSKRGIV